MVSPLFQGTKVKGWLQQGQILFQKLEPTISICGDECRWIYKGWHRLPHPCRPSADGSLRDSYRAVCRDLGYYAHQDGGNF